MAIEQLIRLPLSANWLDRVRDVALEGLRTAPSELRSAGVLAAVELAENALKFGGPLPGGTEAALRLQYGTHELRIFSENGASPERYRRVSEQIRKIDACEDRQVLYLERLNYLLQATANDGVGLGLIRLVHEGGFGLSCSYEEPVLTVSAVRPIPG
ncbi:MAG: hypothetical protein M3020_08350 [Myxococcota bacterium]|nr:hypothetical protein [Myxococcota bacterium]